MIEKLLDEYHWTGFKEVVEEFCKERNMSLSHIWTAESFDTWEENKPLAAINFLHLLTWRRHPSIELILPSLTTSDKKYSYQDLLPDMTCKFGYVKNKLIKSISGADIIVEESGNVIIPGYILNNFPEQVRRFKEVSEIFKDERDIAPIYKMFKTERASR